MQKVRRMNHGDEGFTLIELLIAMVVMGVLTAVAIVGIAGLTDNGSQTACKASRDAANTAAAVYFANHDGYPASFAVLKTEKMLDYPADVTVTGTQMKGKHWTLTMNPSAVPPTFTCS